jgi:hypothetical protein
MTLTSPSDDIDPAVRNEAARHWGWVLFIACGIFCAVTACLLYLMILFDAFRDLRFLIAGLFFLPSCIFLCIGFIQIVSGAPYKRIHLIWHSLRLWRRVLIILFIMGVILFVFPFAYLLLSLPPTTPLNIDI